jgi:hypothetical protein
VNTREPRETSGPPHAGRRARARAPAFQRPARRSACGLPPPLPARDDARTQKREGHSSRNSRRRPWGTTRALHLQKSILAACVLGGVPELRWREVYKYEKIETTSGEIRYAKRTPLSPQQPLAALLAQCLARMPRMRWHRAGRDLSEKKALSQNRYSSSSRHSHARTAEHGLVRSRDQQFSHVQDLSG